MTTDIICSFCIFRSCFSIRRLHTQFLNVTGVQTCALPIYVLENKNIEVTLIKDVIISSVVPNIMYSFYNGIRKYLNCTPLVISAGMKTGMKIECANPKEVGPDRIVDALDAYTIYGGPILVIDFGTATTDDLVSPLGAFVAGITSPGIRICANEVWRS